MGFASLYPPYLLPLAFLWSVARDGTFKHDFGTDMLGLIPWSEFQAHLNDVNGDDEDRIFPVADDHAEQDTAHAGTTDKSHVIVA